MKDNWQVFPTAVRGIDFVGYRHFYGFKLLRKSSCKRFKKKMNAVRKVVNENKPITFTDYCAVNSYNGWLAWCDSFRLSQKYIAPIKGAIDLFYLTQIKRKAVA